MNARANPVCLSIALFVGFVAASPEPRTAAAQTAAPTVIVEWDDDSAASEAHAAQKMAEKLLAPIEAELFTERRASSRPIRIHLHGDFFGGNPPRARVPHVDFRGDVHLYRYGPTHLHALPHELVHAVLRRKGVPYGGFDEEGLAAWVADQVHPSDAGFPTYGQAADLVAGHWQASDLLIPLTRIRSEFGNLNLRCSFQAYSLRKAFFLDLGERHGAGAMRGFFAVMDTPDASETAFGAGLAQLEAAWLERVRAAYAAQPDRVELRRIYRAQPALDELNPCVPGRDFDATGSHAPPLPPS